MCSSRPQFFEKVYRDATACCAYVSLHRPRRRKAWMAAGKAGFILLAHPPLSLGGGPRAGAPCISDSAFGLPDWLETKCNAATIPTCKKSENFKALLLFYQGCYCQITSIQGWSDIGSVISDFSFRELRIVAGVGDSRVVATSKIQLPKMRQPWLDTSNTAYRMLLFLPQYVVAYHRHLLGIDTQSQWRPEGFDAINPRGAVSQRKGTCT